MNLEAAARAQFLALLHVARLGQQFPDAARWRSLLELLGRDGPRGKPWAFAWSPVTGLPELKALAKLLKVQDVAREFFKTHRHTPRTDARAFSMALAALELPPVSSMRVSLMTKGRVNRFVIVHERLGVRFSVVVDQVSGKNVLLGSDQLASLSETFERVLLRACEGTATEAHRVLSEVAGLEVIEIVRGQLGPFVSGAWPAPDDLPVDVRALRSVVGEGAILSVQLERLARDVAKTTLNDPWMGDEPPVKGLILARERRLFCTPDIEARVKALVAGKLVLVRSR